MQSSSLVLVETAGKRCAALKVRAAGNPNSNHQESFMVYSHVIATDSQLWRLASHNPGIRYVVAASRKQTSYL